MQNTIKKILRASIISSVVAIIFGILFLIFPVESLDVFRWIIAILAFGIGIFILVSELSRRYSMPYFGATAIAAVFIVIGIIFATRPAAISIFSIILGAWFIISALGSLRFTSALSGGAAFFSVLLALISFVAGILLIANPWGGSVSMMIVLGASLLVFGVASTINTLVFKSNLDDLSKQIGKAVKEAKTTAKTAAKEVETTAKKVTKGTTKEK